MSHIMMKFFKELLCRHNFEIVFEGRLKNFHEYPRYYKATCKKCKKNEYFLEQFKYWTEKKFLYLFEGHI